MYQVGGGHHGVNYYNISRIFEIIILISINNGIKKK